MAPTKPAHQAAKVKIEHDQTTDHTIETQSTPRISSTRTDSESEIRMLTEPQKRSRAIAVHAVQCMKFCAEFNKMVKEVSGDPSLNMGSYKSLDLRNSPSWWSFCQQAETDDEKAAAVEFIKEAWEHRNLELKRLDRALVRFLDESRRREPSAGG